MIDVLSGFEALDRHVKSSSLNFKDAIIDYYKNLGKEQSYSVVENASVVNNGIDYGRVELVWVEPQVSFNLEFGKTEDIYKKIFLNLMLEPEHAVFILSSKSQCKPKDVAEIIRKTPQLAGLNTVVLDVSGKKVF
ncbi:MAG TPA: hypothetical protein ENN13_04615 [Candidatus Altiarchaeales archaeon]|nr:hypothetical protein [Candidatus Altiarchaeales archaeon]